MGIALLNNYVTNAVHTRAVRLGELLPPQSAEYHRLAQSASALVVRGVHGILPTYPVKTAFAASQSIYLRSQVLGFDSGFVFTGLIVLSAIPLCLMLKPFPHHMQEGEKEMLVE